MDHRCPECGRDLSGRRLSQPIIARMEIDCPHCKRRIRVNVHRLEEALLLSTLAGFVLLAALGYWLERESLYLAAFGAAMLGAAALPLAERVWLRRWPRYVPMSEAVRNSPDGR
jgi:hypothetical protein